MGRRRELKEPRHIDIVLEAEQIRELDRITIVHNRSAVIRWLIQNMDGRALERAMELERENRELKGEIKRLIAKLARLESRLRATGTSSNGDAGDASGSDPTACRARSEESRFYRDYERWRRGLEAHNLRYTRERGLIWIETRAKQLGTSKVKLLTRFEHRYEAGSEERKTVNNVLQHSAT